MIKKKAVVLLSGGLDSSIALAMALNDGFEANAISFSYGQRHSIELNCARKIAESTGILNHLVVDLDMRGFGGSSLIDNTPLPINRTLNEINANIPNTYVPARNSIFLAYSLSWTEVLGAEDIFIGVNSSDYLGYPDCRPEYIRAFEAMAQLATKAGVEGHQKLKIHTPLIQLNKSQIIQKGIELGVNLGLTSSCYDPTSDGLACGRCDACFLRLKGFTDLGLTDPIRYVTK